MNDENVRETVDRLTQEFRRGVLILGVLSQLIEEQYGYSLTQRLAVKGLEIDQGTLYPLLRRLEEQGMLQSRWDVEEGSRPRRYYQISPEGTEVLRGLTRQWDTLVGVVGDLLRNIERS
jgi:DNA-binding PadR family transcriptional regulator